MDQAKLISVALKALGNDSWSVENVLRVGAALGQYVYAAKDLSDSEKCSLVCKTILTLLDDAEKADVKHVEESIATVTTSSSWKDCRNVVNTALPATLHLLQKASQGEIYLEKVVATLQPLVKKCPWKPWNSLKCCVKAKAEAEDCSGAVHDVSQNEIVLDVSGHSLTDSEKEKENSLPVKTKASFVSYFLSCFSLPGKATELVSKVASPCLALIAEKQKQKQKQEITPVVKIDSAPVSEAEAAPASAAASASAAAPAPASAAGPEKEKEKEKKPQLSILEPPAVSPPEELASPSEVPASQ